MVRSPLFGLFQKLNDFLHRPALVLTCCLAFAFANLILDGTLLNWWTLRRDLIELSALRETQVQELARIKLDLKRVKDPQFLEREARDRLDLVSEGDLVFVFGDDEETPGP